MNQTAAFRKWPLVVLGTILAIALLTVFLVGLQPEIDLPHRLTSPSGDHWLGTDTLGRDVGLSILAGAHRSILISIGAALLGGIMGVAAGSLSGFFGDDRLKISVRGYLTGGLLLVIFGYCLAVAWPVALATQSAMEGVFLPAVAILLATLLHLLLRRLKVLSRRISFPLDIVAQRFTEVFAVIPRLYLVIAFAMVIPINLLSLTVLFAITSWDVMSRLVRAEMLKVRAMPYIESAGIIGLSDTMIFFRHALPNVLSPVATQVCFTISSLLIAESTLSFIGVGVSPDVVSWGSIIHGYLENLQAWWLALFPGICIYVTVVSLHALGNDLDRVFERKQ